MNYCLGCHKVGVQWINISVFICVKFILYHGLHKFSQIEKQNLSLSNFKDGIQINIIRVIFNKLPWVLPKLDPAYAI